jgi:hypothetical protein
MKERMTRGQRHIPDRAHPAQGAWHDAGPDHAWQLLRLLSRDRLEHDHWAMPLRQYGLDIHPRTRSMALSEAPCYISDLNYTPFKFMCRQRGCE